MKSTTGNDHPVKKVEYVEDYSINIEEFANEKEEIHVQTLIDGLFYKKTAIWRNENEYRMVRPLTDCPDYRAPKSNYPYSDSNIYLFHFDWEYVNSIIMGAMMSKENKRVISQCCQDHNISLFQAHIVRNLKGRFGMPMIYINPLDDITKRETSNNSEPSIFCTDTYKLSEKRVQKISRLSDLPYYSGYERVVEQFYRNIMSEQNEIHNIEP
jgi:hypothetical protein